MNDKLDQTQKILRSPKVTTDERGRTVWIDPVETANLELVSTQMLKQLMETADAGVNNELQNIAKSDNGLLARDTDNDRFEVITDAELQRILDGTDTTANVPDAIDDPGSTQDPGDQDSEELQLVSTQLLRVVLQLEDDDADRTGDSADSGFNPYNSG